VRALLSWAKSEKRLQILVGEQGADDALAEFAERAVILLRIAFPECQHELIGHGEADDPGLTLLAEEFSRRVLPGSRVPYSQIRVSPTSKDSSA